MNNNNFVKYIFSAIVLIMIFVILFFFIKSRNTKSEESLDQTSTVSNIKSDLRFAISELDTINPIVSHNRNVIEVSKLIYDSLITLDENYKLVYVLAESIEKKDTNTYEVKLRENVKWHDGSQFNFDDVEFTVNTLKRDDVQSIYDSNVGNIDYLEKIDDYKFNIKTYDEVAFYEYNLTFPIISKAQYENEDIFNSEIIPNGTGLYSIDSKSDNMIKLAYFEDYWNSDKKPMVKEINVNLYNSIGEAYQAFKNAELDILSVKIKNIEDHIGTMGYNKLDYRSRDFDFITFNTENPILSDPSVRKAINYMIDKNNLVASCLGSGYTASSFSLDMGNWLYDKDLNVGPNPDEAIRLLESAGWQRSGNGWYKRIDNRNERLAFSIIVQNTNDNRVRAADNIKTQLENYGINVNIQYYSPNSFASAVNEGEYDAAILGLQLGYSPSLETFIGNGNMARYHNDEIGEIRNNIMNGLNDDELQNAYERIFEIYLDEMPYIGLYRTIDTLIYNQNLVGNVRANAFNIYNNIELWYRQ